MCTKKTLNTLIMILLPNKSNCLPLAKLTTEDFEMLVVAEKSLFEVLCGD